MGKDFIYVSQNGFSLSDCYKLLFSGRYSINESSDLKYFHRIPLFNEIEEIELGTDNTKESILRLNDGGFVVVNKTIPINSLK